MANPEHIALLLEGVDAWNEKRRESDFTPDLSKIDLWEEFQKVGRLENNIRIPLRGVDFSGARLFRTSLKRAMLIDANLEGAQLRGADLTGSNLDRANLKGANLRRATLNGADLVHAKLVGADLTRTRPWKAILYEDTDKIPKLPLRDLTLEVKSVADLMEIRSQLEEHYSRDTRVPTDALQMREMCQGGPDIPDTQFYFRGVSQCLPLEPSVMQGFQIDGESLRYAEADLLVDLISRRPEE